MELSQIMTKVSKAMMPAVPEIHGVKLLGTGPVFTDGAYSVFVGYIESSGEKRDIPHYLLVNNANSVVEGSSARLFEARGQCSYMAAQLESQEEMIKKGESLFESTTKEEKKNTNGRNWN
jgi:hypothetical protein